MAYLFWINSTQPQQYPTIPVIGAYYRNNFYNNARYIYLICDRNYYVTHVGVASAPNIGPDLFQYEYGNETAVGHRWNYDFFESDVYPMSSTGNLDYSINLVAYSDKVNDLFLEYDKESGEIRWYNDFGYSINLYKNGNLIETDNTRTIYGGVVSRTAEPGATYQIKATLQFNNTYEFESDIVTVPNLTYTVTFNSNGGSVVQSQQIISGTTATKPIPDPTKEGYVFAGWFVDEALTNEFDFNTSITQDITLYAKWIPIYTVTFNTNGGSAIASQQVEEGGYARRPDNPTKEGHAFVDWYSDSALSQVYNFNTPIAANITLYAKWTVNYYTVTFNSNGGSVVASQSVAWGNKAKIPNEPTKYGYNFSGWYSDASLTAKYNFNTAVTSDLTLYAKWIEKPYFTVTFDSNGGSFVENQFVIQGEKAQKPDTPVKPNYEFVDWYKDSALTTVYDFNTAITSNLTLYAKWLKLSASRIIIPSKNIFNISFDPVIDNNITKVEVGVKGIEPDNHYNESVYNENIINFSTTEEQFNEINYVDFTAPNSGGDTLRNGRAVCGVQGKATYTDIPSILIPKVIDNHRITKINKTEHGFANAETYLQGYGEYYYSTNTISVYNSETIIEESQSKFDSMSYNDDVTNGANLLDSTTKGSVREIKATNYVISHPTFEEENANNEIEIKSILYIDSVNWYGSGVDETHKINLQTKITLPKLKSGYTITEITQNSTEYYKISNIQALVAIDYILLPFVTSNRAETGYVNAFDSMRKIRTTFSNFSITIYGNSVGISLKDKTITLNEGNKVFSFDGNELIQTTNAPSINSKYQSVLDKWKNGKQTATITCLITDYYDINGNKVIDVTTSGKMLFDIGDIAIPYVYTNKGDKPMSYNKNSTPKQFKVVGVGISKKQGGIQELTLQEI